MANINFPPPDYEPPSISSKAPPPPSRPSLPVRAAKTTASRSPWIVLGGVLIEVARLVLSHFGG